MKGATVLSRYVPLLLWWGTLGPCLHAQVWELERVELGRGYQAACAVDSSVVYFSGLERASGRAAIFRSTDGGTRWEIYRYDDWLFHDLSATDSLNVWAVNEWKIYHSNDGGRSWEVQFDASNDTSITKFLDYVEMFDAQHGVVVGDAPANGPAPVLATSDGGKTWEQRNQSFFLGAHLLDLWRGVQFLSPLVGYAAFRYWVPVDAHLQKTVDGGRSWEALPLSAWDIDVVRFFDERVGLAASEGDRPVYLTADGGKSWVGYQPGLGDRWFQDLEFLPGDASTVFAALTPTDWWNPNDVLAVSSDTGKTWAVLPTPPIGCARDVEMVNSQGGWVVGDWGVLRIRAVATPVRAQKRARAASEFALLFNRPNPFSQVTTISLELGRPEPVTIEVFDLRGRRVGSIVEGQRLERGQHAFTFYARALPSGVYLCRAKAGTTALTQRMVLLR